IRCASSAAGRQEARLFSASFSVWQKLIYMFEKLLRRKWLLQKFYRAGRHVLPGEQSTPLQLGQAEAAYIKEMHIRLQILHLARDGGTVAVLQNHVGHQQVNIL